MDTHLPMRKSERIRDLRAREEMKVEAPTACAEEVDKTTSNAKEETSKKRKKAPSRRRGSVDNNANSDTEPSAGTDGEYVVENILNKRIKSGRTEYLIKWFKWPKEANTWEPLKNLAGCKWMVEKFEENYNNKLLGVNVKREVKREGNGGQGSFVSGGIDVRSGYATLSREARRSTLERMEEEETLLKKDLYHGILDECPAEKKVKKIHAVAVVNGFLTHLVEWEAEEEDSSGDSEAFSEANTNMVLAMCMNEKFPQEVISFYESHVLLVEDEIPGEVHKERALGALAAAKKRHEELRRKVFKLMKSEDDDEVDEATKAIEKEQRKRDMFDPYLSDSELSDLEDEFYDELDVEVLN